MGSTQIANPLPKPTWTGIQPYLIVGRIAILLMGSLIYLQLHESARSLTPQEKQEFGYEKPPS